MARNNSTFTVNTCNEQQSKYKLSSDNTEDNYLETEDLEDDDDDDDDEEDSESIDVCGNNEDENRCNVGDVDSTISEHNQLEDTSTVSGVPQSSREGVDACNGARGGSRGRGRPRGSRSTGRGRGRGYLPPAVAEGLARHEAVQQRVYKKKYKHMKNIARSLVLVSFMFYTLSNHSSHMLCS